MKSDSNHVLTNVQHYFCVFCINKQKIILNCVMTNNMVWNERMGPFKHVHITKGKNLISISGFKWILKI